MPVLHLRPSADDPDPARRYRTALDQIRRNTEILRAEMTFTEFNVKAGKLMAGTQPLHSSLAIFSVGKLDEWPGFPMHVDVDGSIRDHCGRFRKDKGARVERPVAPPGTEGIKMGCPALATRNGQDRPDSLHWEM